MHAVSTLPDPRLAHVRAVLARLCAEERGASLVATLVAALRFVAQLAHGRTRLVADDIASAAAIVSHATGPLERDTGSLRAAALASARVDRATTSNDPVILFAVDAYDVTIRALWWRDPRIGAGAIELLVVNAIDRGGASAAAAFAFVDAIEQHLEDRFGGMSAKEGAAA